MAASYLDENNILYKQINGKFVGKQSVSLKDFSSVWMEDVKDKSQIREEYFNPNLNYKKKYKLHKKSDGYVIFLMTTFNNQPLKKSLFNVIWKKLKNIIK